MSGKSLIHYVAKEAKLLGFLDETAYRNVCIVEDFEQLRSEGYKYTDAENILAEKYLLAPGYIHKIVISSAGTGKGTKENEKSEKTEPKRNKTK
jgi:hypothetical protein